MDEEECKCPPAGAPAWMATFSDLATLLLTFFVLLLSFAELNVKEFKEMLGSVRDAFGVQYQVEGHFEAHSQSPVDLNVAPTYVMNETEEVAEQVQAAVEEAELEDQVEVEVGENGVTVRLEDSLLFEPGAAELDPSVAGEIVRTIAELGRNLQQPVAIEGHTDDRPIHNGRFPSNWELSTARAASVLQYVLQQTDLPPERFSLAGYGDTRPLVANDSADNRARNRRVEFRFTRPPEPRRDRGAAGQYFHNLFDSPVEAPASPVSPHTPRSEVEEPEEGSPEEPMRERMSASELRQLGSDTLRPRLPGAQRRAAERRGEVVDDVDSIEINGMVAEPIAPAATEGGTE